jgi:hypothetical protein
VSTRTRWLVLLAFLVVGIGLTVGAVLADGDWQDLWLNLLAEAAGAAFIVLFVDQLLERSKEKEREQRRRAAIGDLGYVLRELRLWLTRLLQESQPALSHDPERVSLETLVDGLPAYLGRIDFAGPGLHKRDRYFVEWARRSFEEVAREIASWEQNFAGAAGIFDDDFRHGAERLRSFVRAAGSFLEGTERYILRERPSSPVSAYEGVTELTEDDAKRLVEQLRDFLAFYRGRCNQHGATVPDFVFDTAPASTAERGGSSR